MCTGSFCGPGDFIHSFYLLSVVHSLIFEKPGNCSPGNLTFPRHSTSFRLTPQRLQKSSSTCPLLSHSFNHSFTNLPLAFHLRKPSATSYQASYQVWSPTTRPWRYFWSLQQASTTSLATRRTLLEELAFQYQLDYPDFSSEIEPSESEQASEPELPNKDLVESDTEAFFRSFPQSPVEAFSRPTSQTRPNLQDLTQSSTFESLPKTHTSTSSQAIMERRSRPTFAICGTFSGAKESTSK